MTTINMKSILLFLLAAFFGALGQYLYKTGAETGAWITNYRIYLGIGCYILVMLFFIFAFKIGGELTVLYPVYAITFIWALVIGAVMLKETIGLYKILGVGFIIFGVFLTTR